MSQLRVGIVGAGHLGKIHARLLNGISQANLVAIAEPSPAVQKELINTYPNCKIVSDYTKVMDEIDAAIVATPTRTHFAITQQLLEAGKHVLVEKPLTDSAADANELVLLADRQNCVLSVGHVERFNAATQVALEKVGQPKFIQANRMSGFTYRSTDIGVVHDLMIHDIDLVNSMFSGKMAEVRAVGIAVIGENEDIANARLQFDCGGVANLTATRCSFVNERSIQIFGSEGFAAVDLANHEVSFVRPPEWVLDRSVEFLSANVDQQKFIRENLFSDVLPKQTIKIEPINAILAEQQDWLSGILDGRAVKVPGRQGAEAVAIAERVLHSLANHCWSTGRVETTGPFAVVGPNNVGVKRTVAEVLPATPSIQLRKAG